MVGLLHALRLEPEWPVVGEGAVSAGLPDARSRGGQEGRFPAVQNPARRSGVRTLAGRRTGGDRDCVLHPAAEARPARARRPRLTTPTCDHRHYTTSSLACQALSLPVISPDAPSLVCTTVE